MTNNTDIVVFLASSLPVDEAQRIVLDACFMPPVQCGDILAVLRFQPKTIVIIDGLFESTAAVWHKEILFAMEQGVRVYGGASMGALRAAELADLGMIGVGEIFEAYYKGELADDDEVAVLHGPEALKYAVLTDAMVNVRATLRLAVQQKIINTATQKLVLRHAKQLNYRQRLLTRAIEQAMDEEGVSQDLQALKQWCADGHGVDQKRLDAVALLERVAEDCPHQCQQGAMPMKRSAFFRALHKDVMCQPFPYHRAWLPEREQKARQLRGNPRTYQLMNRLAYVLASVDSLAESRGFTVPKTSAANEHSAFLSRQARAEDLVRHVESLQEQALSVQDYVTALMRISGAYVKYRSVEHYEQEEPLHYKIVFETARFWCVIYGLLQQAELQPNEEEVQQHMDQFRYQRQLLSPETVQVYLDENEMDRVAFVGLMRMSVLFNAVVMKNGLDVLGVVGFDARVWWLLDVMWLVGLEGAG